MTGSVADRDDVAATLRDLAQQYGWRLGDTARVEQVYGQGIGVRLRPTRAGAVPVGWSEVGGPGLSPPGLSGPTEPAAGRR